MANKRKNPKEEAGQYLKEGYRKQKEGLLEEAIPLYRKSIEIRPTAEAHSFLGWAYSFKKDYDKAIAECRKAIEIDPDYGSAYNDIGAYLIEKGKPEEAVPWLEKALRAKQYGDFCYPYYNLGRISEEKGDWKRALHYYSESLRENANYLLAQRAVARMQSRMN